ncbi:hypothetical protein [Paenalcaligenes niemegkensis]|uniref:hypothetical protein n=1 Tax=Paenalcaligenes niemegkensis TaxID=2895469 RepID=UPI0027E3ADC8|nr:hypothetical protein [Paenalcaligenes niemegkensis]
MLFIVWGVTLLYALIRPAKRAWIELLWLAAALLALLPLLNSFTTERNLLNSILAGDWLFAGFDLTCLAFAGLHACLAIRTQQHRPKVRAAIIKPKATPPAGKELRSNAVRDGHAATTAEPRP